VDIIELFLNIRFNQQFPTCFSTIFSDCSQQDHTAVKLGQRSTSIFGDLPHPSPKQMVGKQIPIDISLYIQSSVNWRQMKHCG